MPSDRNAGVNDDVRAEEATADYERKAKMTEEERLNEARKAKDDELAEKERNITLCEKSCGRHRKACRAIHRDIIKEIGGRK